MRLKRYLQFIKESLSDNSMYWIDEDQIKDIFQYVTDEGYVLNITKVFFGHYGITSGYSGNKFYDPNKNSEDDNFEKRFSFFHDYDANLLPSAVLNEALEIIYERITQDIFNESLAKW